MDKSHVSEDFPELNMEVEHPVISKTKTCARSTSTKNRKRYESFVINLTSRDRVGQSRMTFTRKMFLSMDYAMSCISQNEVDIWNAQLIIHNLTYFCCSSFFVVSFNLSVVSIQLRTGRSFEHARLPSVGNWIIHFLPEFIHLNHEPEYEKGIVSMDVVV